MNTNGAVHTTELFSTEKSSSTTGTIEYVIEHPTHFISPISSGESNPSSASTCLNDGDWLVNHNDLLWGGKPYSTATKYTVTAGCVLSDNGATEKSIFDPCPAGWMVPPGDMWLGFTRNGTNVGSSDYGNINSTHTGTIHHIVVSGCMFRTGRKGSGSISRARDFAQRADAHGETACAATIILHRRRMVDASISSIFIRRESLTRLSRATAIRAVRWPDRFVACVMWMNK